MAEADRGVYKPKGSQFYWIRYAGPPGFGLQRESTGQTDKRVARELRKQRKREIVDGTWKPQTERDDGLLIDTWADTWLAEQHAKRLKSARDIASRIRMHALPVLRGRRLDSFRPKDMITLCKALKEKIDDGSLAPRTARHVWFDVKGMFRDAVIAEKIAATPCIVPPGTVPPKKDKDRNWKKTAVFQRDEVEALISDPRVPWDRRVLYGLEFLLGVRFGEAAGRRWRDYEASTKPLGRMIIDSQYDGQPLKGPHGDAPIREAPVHPVLAAMLAEWFLAGWEATYGRKPTRDDFIVPMICSKTGVVKCRNRFRGYEDLQRDLKKLGLRRRRQHDTRRTLVSIARMDGVPKDKVQPLTHSGDVDIVEGYTTWEFQELCRLWATIRIRRVTDGSAAKVVPLSAHSSAQSDE